jgi:hypothetical protein
MSITAASPKSWPLNTYTASTWTALVAGTVAGESVKGIVITNPSALSITLTIRVASSGGVSQATILPPTIFAPGASQNLNLDVLNLTASQILQIFATNVGLEFYASGVTYA